jgi:hypothetical protein
MGISFNIDDDAFDELVIRLVAEVKRQLNAKPQSKWVSPEEAMDMLRIKSKTTLQKLRDEGRIRYSQPEARVILYDRNSIEAYLDKHAKDTF